MIIIYKRSLLSISCSYRVRLLASSPHSILHVSSCFDFLLEKVLKKNVWRMKVKGQMRSKHFKIHLYCTVLVGCVCVYRYINIYIKSAQCVSASSGSFSKVKLFHVLTSTHLGIAVWARRQLHTFLDRVQQLDKHLCQSVSAASAMLVQQPQRRCLCLRDKAQQR